MYRGICLWKFLLWFSSLFHCLAHNYTTCRLLAHSEGVVAVGICCIRMSTVAAHSKKKKKSWRVVALGCCMSVVAAFGSCCCFRKMSTSLHSIHGRRALVVAVAPDNVPAQRQHDEGEEHNGRIVHRLGSNGNGGRHAEQRDGQEGPGWDMSAQEGSTERWNVPRATMLQKTPSLPR